VQLSGIWAGLARPALEIDQVFKILALKILDIAYEVTYTSRYWRKL